MNKNDVMSKMTSIFRDVLDDEEILLKEEMTADDIEDWDSIAHIQIIVAIEKSFDIKFTSKEVDGFSRVADMVDLTLARIKN